MDSRAGDKRGGAAHLIPLDRVPLLHVVTNHEIVRRPDFLEVAGSVLVAGGPSIALHLRAREVPGRFLYDLACSLADIARDGSLLIVNDRLDVAMAAGFDGVHLGAQSIRASDARRILGSRRVIGASVHSIDSVVGAGGADYLFAGAVFETRSHPGEAARGLEWLRSMTQVAGVPVFAIGGITPDRVPAVLEAGAAGVAVIRGVWDAESPADATHSYLAGLQ